MSKIDSLGALPRFAGADLKLDQNGKVLNPISLPEITKINTSIVHAYQTYFRQCLFSLYSQQNTNTIDNFIVNVALEGGYDTPIYRALARVFTLTSLNLASQANRDLNPDELKRIGVIVLVTNPTIKNELAPMVNDSTHSQWFGNYRALIDSAFGREVHSNVTHFSSQQNQQVAWGSNQQSNQQASWGSNQSSSQSGGWGTQQQQAPQGQGWGTQQNSPANNLGLNDPTANVASSNGNTSGGFGGWGATAPQATPQTSTPVTQTSTLNHATTRDGIVTLSSDVQSNNMHLSTAKGIKGGWCVRSSPNEAVATVATVDAVQPSEWIMWNGIAGVRSKDLDSTNGMAFKDIDRTLEDIAKSSFNSVASSKLSLDNKRRTYQTEVLITQLELYNNPDGLVCDLNSTPWGMPSLVDLLADYVPNKVLEAIPDECYRDVLIGNRVYPCFNMSHSTVIALGKFLGKGLETGSFNDLWYVIVPFVNNNTQELKMFNLLHGDSMDLDNYKPPMAGFKPQEEKVVEGKPVIESKVYHYSQLLTGGPNGAINVMRVMANDDNATVIGKSYKFSFLTLDDKKDQDAYMELKKAYQAKEICNVKDLTNAYSNMLDAGVCSKAFADTLDARCQDVYMSAINGAFEVDLRLDDIWRLEVEDVFGMMFNDGTILTLENQNLLRMVDSELLEGLFTEIEDEDELRLAAKMYQTSTGIETRLIKGAFNARFASVDSDRNLTLKIGEGIIPIMVRSILVGVPFLSSTINPGNSASFNGYKLPNNVIRAINDLDGTITLVSSDGVQYAVSVHGNSELDAPSLLVL
jgi:hypothetical protein